MSQRVFTSLQYNNIDDNIICMYVYVLYVMDLWYILAFVPFTAAACTPTSFSLSLFPYSSFRLSSRRDGPSIRNTACVR